LERLNALTAFSDDPLLRLAALLAVKRTDAEAIGLKLRLSAKERERLAALATPLLGERDSYRAQKFALYRLGLERYRDLALLAAADGQIEPHRVQELLDWAKAWEIPRFPLGGDDVTALGIAPGPRTGQLLAEVRGWWEEGDFAADRAACLAKLKELAARP
jgi:poly(A) polymerase